MELRLPLEVFPGRQATCRAVFGTWGSFPDDARASHCPFVLTSFRGWSSKRCPGIGVLRIPRLFYLPPQLFLRAERRGSRLAAIQLRLFGRPQHVQRQRAHDAPPATVAATVELAGQHVQAPDVPGE